MSHLAQHRFTTLILSAVGTLALCAGVASAQAPPTVTTNAATGVTAFDSTLNGTVNANGASTSVTFEYGLDTGYGTTRVATPSPVTGSVDTAVAVAIGELIPNTTYHFRVVGVNTFGTTYGDDMTCTTGLAAPDAATAPATAVGPSGATLNGSVNALNASTTVTFEYGNTTAYGSTVSAPQSPVNGITATPVSAVISGLTAGQTYHFRVVAASAGGTSYGDDLSFVAGIAPTVTTNAATSVVATSATLNATVNANGASTAVTFELGTTTAYGRTIAASPSQVTGTTNTTVSAAATALAPNTTYHFRAVGQNPSGTTCGADMTLTTPKVLPTAVTLPASGVTATGATLNGSVNAGNDSTNVTFQYGLTTAYGTTVTASQSPLGGVTTTAVSRAIGGLTTGQTYHFRVVAESSSGTAYGEDQVFSTGGTAPDVVTMAASPIAGAWAIARGTVDPNGNGTVVRFEFGPSPIYGRTATADQSPVTGDGAQPVTATLTDLIPGSVYHFRAVGENGIGLTLGADMSLTTLPLVVTRTPDNVTTNGATLRGEANAGNLETTVSFEYGPTTAYGTAAAASPSPITLNLLRQESLPVTGLLPNTTYHYRIAGQSTAGTAYGNDVTFTTEPVLPSVATSAASGVTAFGATLNGTVNANFASTNVTFEYGLSTAYGTIVAASESPVSGSTDTAVSTGVTGLEPNTTYHFRVGGRNLAGMATGDDLTFTTTAIAPVVVTLPASNVATTGATLNGTVNACNQTTTVTFEYGLTTAYGTSVPATPDQVEGFTITPVSFAAFPLQPGTTYHYRVVAQNATGVSYGEDMTLVTAPAVPTLSDLGLLALVLALGLLALRRLALTPAG